MQIDQQAGEALDRQKRRGRPASVPDTLDQCVPTAGRLVGGLTRRAGSRWESGGGTEQARPSRSIRLNAARAKSSSRRLSWWSIRSLALCVAIVAGTACSMGVPSLPARAPLSSTVAARLPTVTPLVPASETSTAAPIITAETTSPTAAVATAPALAPTVEPSPTLAAATIAEAAPTQTATVVVEVPPAPTALPPVNPGLAAELQRILDSVVASGYIPGAVMAVSIPGEETWLGATGYTDRSRTQAMATNTRFRIASISKVFTAVVMLQLAEEGRIDLDAPMSTWLPGLVPLGDQITVRRLLQHQTGLHDYLEDPNFRERAYQAPERVWAPRELVSYAASIPLAFQPGAPGAWDYSSTNYVTLGMLVEQVTGRTLAQEMRQRIFEPLQLEGTFFAPDEPVVGTLARGYGGNRDLTGVQMSFGFATANVVSTAADVQRFIRALIGGELMQPETLEAMFTFVNGHGQYNMPTLEYGLGLMRNQLPVGPAANGQARAPEASTVVGHTGGFAGFRSVVWSAPESGITLSVGMNQSDTDPNIVATQVWDAILRSQGR